MKVLLIGNYLPDQQYSMRRFSTMLEVGLRNTSVEVELFTPPVFFAKLTGCSNRGLGKWLGYIDKYVVTGIVLRNKLRGMHASTVVHICDHSNAHYVKAIQNLPHLITCHDLIAVRSALGKYEESVPRWTGRKQQSLVARSLKKIPAIISVSEQTRRHVEELLATKQARHYVISNALDQKFIEASHHPWKEQAEDAKPYILLVGNAAWYKNRPDALKLIYRITNDIPELDVRVVGPDVSEEELAPYRGLSERISYNQDLSDDELIDIYRGARLLIFPSIIEGFGWPIIEAQACGCPVFTLDREPMSALNASPDLIAKVDRDHANFLEDSTKQCLAAIRESGAERHARSETLQAFSRQFNISRMVGDYLRVYEEELSAQ